MDKEKQRQVRKDRKKAIKLQNSSAAKLSMAEALRRVRNADSDS